MAARRQQGSLNVTKNEEKMMRKLRFATINVGTMNKRKRKERLAKALGENKIDIACIQETRMKDSNANHGSGPLGEQYYWHYSISTEAANGVAIVLSKEFMGNISAINFLSDRLISLIIEIDKKYVCVVSCYAPQQGSNSKDKDTFWDTINDFVAYTNAFDLLIIGGDLNGHVGAERVGYQRCHGGQGFGTRNDEGLRILNFSEAHDLAVTNTFFIKHPKHLITYESSTDTSQIDYFLISRRFLPLVTDVKVLPTREISTQHYPLVMYINFCLEHHISSEMWAALTKIDRWCLPGNEPKLAEDMENIRKQENWRKLTEKICSSYPRHTDTMRLNLQFYRYHSHLNPEQLLLYIQWRFEQYINHYNVTVSAERTKISDARAAKLKRLLKKKFGLNVMSNVRRLANTLGISRQDIVCGRRIKSSNGHILRGGTEIIKRWSEYFCGMLNTKSSHFTLRTDKPVSVKVPAITSKEVCDATEQIASEEAAESDNIPFEVWEVFSRCNADVLTWHFNQIIAIEPVPSAFKEITIIPLWKGSGDTNECFNYRPHFLLCKPRSILENIIAARLESYHNSIFEVHNDNNSKTVSMRVDAIQFVLDYLHKQRKKNKPVHVAFLDLKDSLVQIPHYVLWEALRSHEVPEEYIQLVMRFYERTAGVVRCLDGVSSRFDITAGIQHGSRLSLMLEEFCMDSLKTGLSCPHSLSFLCADKVVLVSEHRQVVQFLVNRWKKKLMKSKMTLDVNSVLHMECGMQTAKKIYIDNMAIKKVSEFTYFDFVVSRDRDVSPHIRSRIRAAWICWRQLSEVLCDEKVPIIVRMETYQKYIFPVLFYGYEFLDNMNDYTNGDKQLVDVLARMTKLMFFW